MKDLRPKNKKERTRMPASTISTSFQPSFGQFASARIRVYMLYNMRTVLIHYSARSPHRLGKKGKKIANKHE